MAKAALAEIVAAEDRARRIREDAIADAKARVDQTEKECREKYDREEMEIRKNMNLHLAQIRADVEQDLANSRLQAVNQAQDTFQDNQDKMEDAVRYIVRSVLDQWQF
ncbi:MAG: hypothetical protein IJU20_05375 [Clostridia bacterium]|nr:hypothetical protein [Clostridia bacterium]